MMPTDYVDTIAITQETADAATARAPSEHPVSPTDRLALLEIDMGHLIDRHIAVLRRLVHVGAAADRAHARLDTLNQRLAWYALIGLGLGLAIAWFK